MWKVFAATFASILILFANCQVKEVPEKFLINFNVQNESLEADILGRSMTVYDLHEVTKIGQVIPTPQSNKLLIQTNQWKHDRKPNQISTLYIFDVETEKYEVSAEFQGFSIRFAQSVQNKLFFLGPATVGEDVIINLFCIDFPFDKDSKHIQITYSSVDIDTFHLSSDGLKIAYSLRVYPQFESNVDATRELDKIIEKRGKNTYQIFDQLMVNHWDKWDDKKVSNIFYQTLNTDYTLSGAPVNIMANINPANSPVPPFGGDEEYDISFNGEKVVFTAALRLNEATDTRWIIYLASINGSEVKLENISRIDTDHAGRSQNPKFSSDAAKVFYTAMPRNHLESDYTYLTSYNILDAKTTQITKDFKYPVNNYLLLDESTVLFTSDWDGSVELFTIKIGSDAKDLKPFVSKVLKTKDLPVLIKTGEKIIAYLSDQDLVQPKQLVKYIFQDNLFNENSFLSREVLFDPNPNFTNEFAIPKFEIMHFEGDTLKNSQGWVVYPANYNENSEDKYPVVLLIHGGPEGAWHNSFGFGWSSMIYASQGYFTVTINPEGSWGFGQDFVDAVRNDWGGAPFRTLMKGMKHFTETYHLADRSKACAAGASYGGYMVNWIQGDTDPDNKFNCLITHDGVFSTLNMFYITDELWFPIAENCLIQDESCNPWSDKEEIREGFIKFSPESRIENWRTPHLIVHGTYDLRIPISEGLSAFTALQMKKIPSKFLHFPLENHWVLKTENSIAWYENVLSWIENYTHTK